MISNNFMLMHTRKSGKVEGPAGFFIIPFYSAFIIFTCIHCREYVCYFRKYMCIYQDSKSPLRRGNRPEEMSVNT